MSSIGSLKLLVLLFAGVGVVVVMLVCVGFIVSLIILGVMRVRNTRRCGGSRGADLPEDKQELDWDNSALTVTVNPMHPDVSIVIVLRIPLFCSNAHNFNTMKTPQHERLCMLIRL